MATRGAGAAYTPAQSLYAFVRTRECPAYNLAMGSLDQTAWTLVRIALCLAALSAGALAARYTDIARHDRTRFSPSEISALPAQGFLRASVR